MIDKVIVEALWRDFIFLGQATALLTIVVVGAVAVLVSLGI